MMKEIGSSFWLSHGEKNRSTIDCRVFNTDYEDSVFTTSGRGAMSLILSELKAECKRVLLPSFTCESVIDPFIKHGYEVFYYSVDRTLNIREEAFLKEIGARDPSVVLIHSYYGFDTASEVRETVKNLRASGITVIEDITQTLYSSFPRLSADYYVGSFRKWEGLSDGGFALKVKGSFAQKPQARDDELRDAGLKAMTAKYDYLFGGIGEKSAFLQMFAEAEELLEREEQVYRMSDASYFEHANLDIEDLRSRRRGNFRFLLDNLRNERATPLFKELPDDTVPLYFPILCRQDRKEVQVLLREKSVYAPVVWPKPDNVKENYGESDLFYTNLLCIPCDQRYGLEEMNYIVEILNS